jgi:hypothetical protein
MGEERESRCREVRAQLSSYLEEDLDGRELGPVEAHLADCESCRVDLELLRHTLKTLRALPEIPAPAAILHGVRKGTAPKRPLWSLGGLFGGRPAVGLPLGAAATLLVAFGIFLLADRFPDLGTPRPPEMSGEDFRRDAPASPVTASPLLAPPPEKATPDAGAPVEATVPELSAVKRGDDITIAGKVLPGPRQSKKAKERRERLAAEPGPPQDEESSTLDRDGGEGRRESVPLSAARREAPEEAMRETPPGPVAALVSRKEKAVVAEGSTVTMESEGNAFFDAPDPPGMPEERPKEEAGGTASRETSGNDGRRMLYRKSLPPRDHAETGQFAAPRAAAPLPREIGERDDDGAPARREEREVLTIVSFGDEEVRLLRESLEQAGGTLLEMKNLDAMMSQQVALPHQDRIPPDQMISRGWQVRALLPLSRADEFVALLEGQSELQLLERVTETSPWTGRPGTQLFEINLVR